MNCDLAAPAMETSDGCAEDWGIIEEQVQGQWLCAVVWTVVCTPGTDPNVPHLQRVEVMQLLVLIALLAASLIVH